MTDQVYFGSKSHPRYVFFLEASHSFEKLGFFFSDDLEIQEHYSLIRDNIYVISK